MNEKDIKDLNKSFPYLTAEYNWWTRSSQEQVFLPGLEKEDVEILIKFLIKEYKSIMDYGRNVHHQNEIEELYNDKLSELKAL